MGFKITPRQVQFKEINRSCHLAGEYFLGQIFLHLRRVMEALKQTAAEALNTDPAEWRNFRPNMRTK